MALREQGSGTDPPEAAPGQVELHLPILGGRGTLATSAAVEMQPAGGAGASGSFGRLDATVTLQTTSALRLALPGDRGTMAGDLNTAGRLRLRLALPGRVERLDGDITIDGPLAFSIVLPAGAGTLTVPATIDATAGVRTTAPGCVRLDAQSSFNAPLALRLPLLDGHGTLEMNTTLSGDATLGMALPGGHGQLQARLLAAGPYALTLALPDSLGQIAARGAISTPLTLSLVVPDGRAKLAVHDTITGDLALRMRLPRGGSVDASAPIHGRLDGTLWLPSGQGELRASVPLHSTVHLNKIVIPQFHRPLTMDVQIDGVAELALDRPGRGTQLRAHFEAELPLAPFVRLVHAEVARQVPVEYVELLPPRLISAHEVALSLYVEARRGVLVRVEATAHLRIDPRSNRIELRSVHAHGINAAGRAASWFFLNPRLFRALRHSRLFDPSGVLPVGARIEALGFKAASHEALIVEGGLVFTTPSSAAA